MVPNTVGMQALRLVLAAAVAAAAVAGCRPDDTGAVLLHLDQRSDVASLPATYSSSTAAVALTGDGLVHLTATSNQGVLTVLFVGPLIEGSTVELPPDDERLHFTIDAADWANRGGTLIVLSTSPAIVSFVGVPMEARSGAAVGSFVFDGGGTFR
ncbi:MAG: hypothetical protein JWM53_5926 [bacterium]|nr:hypothetical protein [bacterium]